MMREWAVAINGTPFKEFSRLLLAKTQETKGELNFDQKKKEEPKKKRSMFMESKANN
jgi:hypothetical protein